MGYLETSLAILHSQTAQIDADRGEYENGEKKADKAGLSPLALVAVATLPHGWWAIWRSRSGEIQAGLGVEHPTVEQIRDADHRAFLELMEVINALPPSAVAEVWPDRPKTVAQPTPLHNPE